MLSGRRRKKPATTADPNNDPESDGAINNPKASGSSASDQLPCSLGRMRSRKADIGGWRARGKRASMWFHAVQPIAIARRRFSRDATKRPIELRERLESRRVGRLTHAFLRVEQD